MNSLPNSSLDQVSGTISTHRPIAVPKVIHRLMPSFHRLTRLRLHPFFIDVLLTGATQAFILAANLVMVSLVNKWMGVVALGEFLLLKRVSSWLLMGTQLGLGVALPREIAHACDDTGVKAKQYFAAAMATLVPLLLLTGSAAVAAPSYVAQLCFGSRQTDLVYALVLFLAGAGLQTMIFAYYRGLQKMRYANCVQLGGLVVVPLIALMAARPSQSTAQLMGITGIFTAAISIAWAIFILIRVTGLRAHLVPDARRLLTYGVVRVPGDIAAGALLAAGPILAAHYTSMGQLSYLLLGITCLSMAGLAFWPVVMMLLAKVSKMLGSGRNEDVKLYVQHLRSAVFQLSALAMTQALIFSSPLVRWWLGASYLPGIPVICILLGAIPGYMYYYAMRSVLDAASSKAYNTRNVIAALGTFFTISVVVIQFAPRNFVMVGVSAAMTIAFYVLAVATDFSLRRVKLVDRSPELTHFWIILVLAGLALGAQLAFRFEISKLAFCAVVLIETAITAILVRRSQPKWVVFMRTMALSRG